jgi:hypothetical protein
MYPFKQIRKNDTIIREFAADVSSEELVWHRDLFDRRVQVLEGNEWYIQIDNQVPKKLIEEKTYFIPAHNYHRLIKGKGKLVVSIQENKEITMKITKRQLRRIIANSVISEDTGQSGRRGQHKEALKTLNQEEYQSSAYDSIRKYVDGTIDASTLGQDVEKYIKSAQDVKNKEGGYLPRKKRAEVEGMMQLLTKLSDAGGDDSDAISGLRDRMKKGGILETFHRGKIRISKRQLNQIIREEYSKLKRRRMSEGVMSMIHIEIQNAIAEAVEDLSMMDGRGTTIEDIHMYIDGSNIQFSHGYVPDMEEIEQIVYDMVDAGDLMDDGRGYLMLSTDNSTY